MDTSQAPADHGPKEFRDSDLSGALSRLLEGGATLVVASTDVENEQVAPSTG
jgi:hypothetical protein